MQIHQKLAFRVLSAAALFTGVSIAQADVRMPPIFGSGMVIQQGIEAPVWGTADPGEQVTVTFAGQEKQTVADDKGKWQIRLSQLKAQPNQTGQTMTVKGKNILTFNDVLIGEVWLCSGQSNMQWLLRQSQDGANAIKQAKNPNIRLFTLSPFGTGEAPTLQYSGQWQASSPETAANFSAVGYYFGRDLQQNLDIPIGLISNPAGGTVIQSWTSREALLKNHPEYTKAYEDVVNPGRQLASLKAEREESLAARQAAIDQLAILEADVESSRLIASETFDDTAWKKVTLPGNYSSNRMASADGSIWLRRTITLPASWDGKDIILRLGQLVETDVTWFNGQIVGKTGSLGGKDFAKASSPREYKVPGQYVKAGTNTIAIRVIARLGRTSAWGSRSQPFDVVLADAPTTPGIDLKGQWMFNQETTLPVAKPDPQANRNRPTILFNTRVYPLIPYAIRGVIWYQGESNASNHQGYRTMLPTMINDWRSRWGQGDMPFLVVQLAGFGVEREDAHDTNWANLREAQAYAARTMPNVELAVAIDVGDARDIHPRNKEDVGKRLALIALARTYGKNVVYAGPTYKSMTIEGNKARIHFDHVDGGLKVKGDKLGRFIIAGKDGVFHEGIATIDGNDVVVHSPNVPEPAAVRYAWGNTPPATLYNGHDLPAVPFATDKWSNEK